MLRSAGDFAGVSIASACRIVRRVSESIAALQTTYIKMPNRNEELEMVAAEFYRIARFPRVIGAIDCTLIRMDKPVIRTRNVVERQYGVWKRRFPVLKLGMRLNVNTIMAVIVATAVLHNMAIEENEDIPADWMANSSHEDDEVSNQNVGTQENQSGQFVRELLINEHFSNL
nr:unnamed protein product [Callosobruchus chinensis]